MKKSLIIVTSALVLVSAIVSANINNSGFAKALSDRLYTVQDAKNLSDFILNRETPDLSEKDYDIYTDNVWDVFDMCLMRRKLIEQNASGYEKTLIVYFSLGRNSGNFETADATTSASILIDNNTRYSTTEYVADLIRQEAGGDIYPIITKEPYPQDYDEVIDQNHSEMAENYIPELAGEPLDVSQYDTVYIGYPIWATTVPRAIHTFLNKYDMSGKTVIPFCTHNGYGKGNSESVIAELCKDSDILDGFAIDSRKIRSAEEEVKKWIKDIGMAESDNTEIYITVGSRQLNGVIYDTPLAKEIMGMMPLTVSMVGYGGREYYGGMPQTPENTGSGQFNFENGDITYCPTNNTLAIFYAQTSRPNLTMEVIPIGKVTSDLAVFDTLNSREDITFSVVN